MRIHLSDIRMPSSRARVYLLFVLLAGGLPSGNLFLLAIDCCDRLFGGSFLEFLDPACRIHQLLLAGEERMAI